MYVYLTKIKFCQFIRLGLPLNRRNFICNWRSLITTNAHFEPTLNHENWKRSQCFKTFKKFLFSSPKSYGYKKKTSHYCGDLCLKDLGKHVTLRGFLQYQRMGLFCILRDSFGLVQILIKDDKTATLLKDTPYESYIEVSGEVISRPKEDVNKFMKTGHIEVSAQELVVLNKAKTDLPFLIRNKNQPTEMLGLKYRYLDLRHQYLQDNLRFRSKLGKKIRDFLQDERDFLEITTPSLSVKTPGGSQEFVVPSQLDRKFYSLVQSPQTYKQLAVIGGFENYFQFAICYRDEGGRPDRQPEFMQLDIEVANATCEEIRDLMEDVVVKSWLSDVPAPPKPFPSITFQDAMGNYGVDKPDARFEWKICDVSSAVSLSTSTLFADLLKEDKGCAKAFVIPAGEKYVKKKDLKRWEDLAQRELKLSGVAVLGVKEEKVRGRVAKALGAPSAEALIKLSGAQDGDSIVLAVGHKTKVLKLLGKLRLLGAEVLEGAGVEVRPPGVFSFLWVLDFPLFERDETTGDLVSSHHPFTAPHSDHLHLLHTSPEEMKSQHYDLVLNGSEIAGGSIRIHDAKVQNDVLQILNVDSTPLNFLLEALECGAPPHGGIALGFDRYLSILRRSKSVREVMAFPKSSEGKCLMSGAPGFITEKDKKLYQLNCSSEEEKR